MNKALDKFVDTRIGNICVHALCWVFVPMGAITALIVFSALDRLKGLKSPG